MAKVFIEETTLTSIGDAIRSKTGKTELIDPANMSAEIESIDSISYDESKIIEASATAAGMLVLNDVSEMPHEVEVEVSGENIDLSQVMIKVQGKNLFSNDISSIDDLTVPKVDGSSDTYSGYAIYLPKGTYTINIIDETQKYYIYSVIADNNNLFRSSKQLVAKAVNNTPYTFTIDSGDVFYMYNGSKAGVSGAQELFKQLLIQIEFGSHKSNYEPYIEPVEYIVNTEGIIKDALSISPNMTFIPNADGVQLTANYYKSWGMQTERDRFWDSFQDNGNRTDYMYAFYGEGWNNSTFAPKYPMKPKNPSYMFDSCKLTNFDFVEKGISLDLSNATLMTYMFRNCKGILRIGVIDCLKCKELNRLFYSCNIKTIDNFIVNENNVFNNTFQFAADIENITISGTIGQNGFDTKYSTKLSRTSIENIIGCLSITTEGMSITLSKVAVDKAFETSEGANDGSTSAEWLALVDTRSNWTIGLV